MSALKRTSPPAHAGPSQPFQVLVREGADPEKLNRLLAWVDVGAELEKRFKPARKLRTGRRRADEARLKRIPSRLRAVASEIENLISRPEFDPRTLLPNPARPRLVEAVAEAQKHSTIRELVNEWTNIPSVLYEFAAYVEARRDGQFHRLPQPGRPDAVLRRAKVRLLDYVESATGRPHYEEVADLLSGSSRILTADDLRKLSTRNPSLRRPVRLF